MKKIIIAILGAIFIIGLFVSTSYGSFLGSLENLDTYIIFEKDLYWHCYCNLTNEKFLISDNNILSQILKKKFPIIITPIFINYIIENTEDGIQNAKNWIDASYNGWFDKEIGKYCFYDYEEDCIQVLKY